MRVIKQWSMFAICLKLLLKTGNNLPKLGIALSKKVIKWRTSKMEKNTDIPD